MHIYGLYPQTSYSIRETHFAWGGQRGLNW